MRAGRAFVELFAHDSKLVRGLKRAQYKLRAFGQAVGDISRQLMGLGVAVFAPLAASAKAFSSMGDAVATMAKRTGLSVETLKARMRQIIRREAVEDVVKHSHERPVLRRLGKLLAA